MKTTVDLDEGLLRRAKEVAARTHRTLTLVLEDALRRSLKPVRQQARPRRVRLPVSGGPRGIRPGVDLDDSAALLDVLERGDAAN